MDRGDPERETEAALWIVPPGNAYHELTEIIKSLSLRYGTPCFQPHITVLGHITGNLHELTEKVSRLARSIRPFKVKLNGIDCLDEYFRAVFIRAEMNDELMSLHLAAKKEFCGSEERAYMPHVSLLYGDIPHDAKDRIIAGIGSGFPSEFNVPHIDLIKASVSTDPRKWKPIAAFPLPSRGR